MEWYERICFYQSCRGIGDGMQAKWTNGSMAELVRHGQTKGSVTDRLRLNHRATPRLHKNEV